MSDDRRAVYQRADGVVVFRASSVGICTRALVASRRGEDELPPSDYLEQVFAAGWEYEDAIIARLEYDGWEITRQQEEYVIDVINGVVIVGHIDGVATNKSTGISYVAEFKSMGPSVFPSWLNKGPRKLKSHGRYAAQATVAMMGMNMPLLYACMERTSIEEPLPIEDRPFYTFTLSEPPIPWEPLRQKVVMAEGISRVEDEWPDCDVPERDRHFCFFKHLHRDDNDVEILDDAELAHLFRKAAQAQRILDSATSRLKEYKKELRSILEDRGLSKAIAAGVTVNLIQAHTTRLDLDRLRADMGEEIERYEYTQNVTRVQVKGVTPGKRRDE